MLQARLPFCKLLPFVALALCVAVLAAFTTLSYLNLRRISAHGRAVLIHNHEVNVRIPPKQFFIASIVAAGTVATRPIQAINMPAMVTEALVSATARTWPDSWRPAAFGPTPVGLFAWRGLIFPIYCLPFWWFVGLGLDALLKQRYLRWPTLLIGTLLCGLLIVIVLGFTFTLSAEDHKDGTWIFCGFSLWILLFGTFPAAWLRQWLSSRRHARLALY